MHVNWFEIEVSDFDKSKTFYESIFGIPLEVHIFDGEKHGFFPFKEGPNGVIVERREVKNGNSLIIFFHVISVSGAIRNVEAFGGNVITPKTLMKSEKDGSTVISNTLIDGEMGYFAKIADPDGNIIGLHSNA